MLGDRKESAEAAVVVAAFGLRPLLFPMYIVPFLLTLICGPSFPPKEAAKVDKDWVAVSPELTATLEELLESSSVLGPNNI